MFQQNSRSEVREMGDRTGAVTSEPGAQCQNYLRAGMAVRRLTPRECERLQGLPDDYTLVAWRGKPEGGCPDGPRYKAIGNSMAVPVMRWIGRRIQRVDSIGARPTILFRDCRRHLVFLPLCPSTNARMRPVRMGSLCREILTKEARIYPVRGHGPRLWRWNKYPPINDYAWLDLWFILPRPTATPTTTGRFFRRDGGRRAGHQRQVHHAARDGRVPRFQCGGDRQDSRDQGVRFHEERELPVMDFQPLFSMFFA